MKGLSLWGGNGSRNNQAGNDIVDNSTHVHNHGPSLADMRTVTEEIKEELRPALALAARAEWDRLNDEFTTTVIAGLEEADAKAVASFQEIRMQIALGDAQRGYAATPDSELKDILADLVVGAANEVPRSHRDLILRQSISIATKVTAQQLNTLVILALLRNFHFGLAPGPRAVLDYLDQLYAPYTSVVTESGEFSYLASLGCGVEAQLTAEAFGAERETPKIILQKQYQLMMYDSFTLDDFTDRSGPELVADNIVTEVEPYPPNSDLPAQSLQLYRFTADFAERVVAAGSSRMTNTVEASLLRHLAHIWQPQHSLEKMIAEDYPALEELFEILDKTNALHFHINAVGRMLAAVTASNRTPERKAEFEKILLGPSERPSDPLN